MDSSKKQIDCCIKIFALLRLLLEDNATFSQVVSVIADDGANLSDTNIYSVTLNKYLNTLRLFGLNVKKEHGRYHLINPPYKIELDEDEFQAFNILKKCTEQLNDEKTKEELEKFIKSFELRFDETTQKLAKSLSSQTGADFSFYYEDTAKQEEICAKFCNEDYKVEIIYYGSGHIEKKIIAKAQELLYRRKSIKLQVQDLSTMQPKTIGLDKIISIKQLPTKTAANTELNSVVVFGLRGRLAKNYTMRSWEYSGGQNGEWSIIINRDEDKNELTKRVLKYGDLCKIISPRDFKNSILGKFEKMLQVYEG